MQKNYQKPKKLNYQLQQVAFQKYPFQINNKPFFCYQSYFEDQLLNGVDLQLEQAKGMSSEPQKVAYMPPSQQLVLAIGSNLIAFNTQKRFYSLLAQVDGFVQILRTYNCKINNKSYLFWLQSEQEGRNKKKISNIDGKKTQPKETYNLPQNTSMSKLLQSNQSAIESNIQQQDNINKSKLKTNKNQQDQIYQNNTIKLGAMKKNIKKQTNSNLNQQKANKKQKKIYFGQGMYQSQLKKNKIKKMKITIFDYERKKVIHKQPIEILEQETIQQIIFYCTPEKILGYVINNQSLQRARIYYRRIQFDESNPKIVRNTISKRYLHKKDDYLNKAEKFNVTECKLQINSLKYNGQADSYLFKHNNKVYGLQLLVNEYEKSSKISLNKLTGSSNRIESSNSINLSDNSQNDNQNLSRSILQAQEKKIQNDKSSNKEVVKKIEYKIKVHQQIQISQDEKLIDFSLNQVYLVILTTKSIIFYSVFNLKTLLFKSYLPNLNDYPQLHKIQINKSYLILTHQKSTYISLFTILEQDLKYNTTCQIEIEHCEGILKLFMNNYNCEVTVLAKQFQIEGRMTNIIKSKKIIVNSAASFKKTFIDVSLAYINFSNNKCQSKSLFLKQQKFKDVLTCKWHSEYLIQTQNQIIAKDWRQSFDNLKCASLHPTGQYIIIGFNDCFKVYAVTFQGLQNTYMSDGIKDCQTIAYSEYGEHFAVGSANSIGIYNSYNCRKKQTISFPVGTLVQSLQYRSGYLFCVLKNKRVMVYQILLDYKQIFMFNPRNYINENKHQIQRRPGQSNHNLYYSGMNGLMTIQINSLFYDINLDVVIFSYGKKLFFLNTLTNQSLGSYEMEVITCMQYSQYLSTLFLGTETGQLIAFPWPNKPSNILDQLPRFKFHCQKLTKIKLTPDFKYLMTISADLSIYKSNISYILNLKRLKGNQICQYKGNKPNYNFTNFLYNKGFCQFSQPQNIQKIQTKKQYEEQVVNTVFMLPEQRLKQKQNLFSQLSNKKTQILIQNRKAEEPLQIQSLALRTNVIKLKDQYQQLRKLNQGYLQQQRISIKEQTSKLLKIYSELNTQIRSVKIDLNQDMQKIKYMNNKKYQQQLNKNDQQYKQLERKLKDTNNQTDKSKNQFLQINLIDQQKEKYLENHLKTYVKELEILNSKNGQMTCKNSALQKEILMLKYRIQQLKFVSLNSNESIDKLKKKKQKQTEDRLIFQKLLVENAQIDVSEMQKKYIKATKQLIEKNKQIDIKLIQYEKQRQILVKLQKTVEKTQLQIDAVVDDLSKQKQFMRQIKNKLQNSGQRLIQLTKLKDKKKILKSINKLQLKKFVQQLENIKINYQNQQIILKEQLIHYLKGILITSKKTKQDNNQQQIFTNEDNKNKLTGQIIKTNVSNNLMKKTMKFVNFRNFTETFNENKKQSQNNDSKKKFQLDLTQKGFNPSSTQRVNFRSTERNFKKNSKTKYLPISTEGNQTSRNNLTNDAQYQIPVRYQQQVQIISKQKQDIQKKLSTQQKLTNNIKTERGLFVSIQKKLNVQSQDLIATYNSLSYDNKSFRNILQLYQTNLTSENTKHVINKPKNIKQSSKKILVNFQNEALSRSSNFNSSNPASSVSNLPLKKTPFQKYLAHKQKKMADLNNQNKPNIKFINKQANLMRKLMPQSQVIRSISQKRIKTVPCSQFKI